MLLSHSLFKLPELSWIMPWLTAIGVFYWALFAPHKFHLSEAFVLGLIEDIIVGTPLGFHAAGLVLLHFLAQSQIQGLAGRSFIMVWVMFGVMLAACLLVLSVILWLAGVPFSLWVSAVWLVTTLSFPLVFVLLASSQQYLMRRY